MPLKMSYVKRPNCLSDCYIGPTRTAVKHSDTKPEIYNTDYRPNASPLQIYTNDATGHDIR